MGEVWGGNGRNGVGRLSHVDRFYLLFVVDLYQMQIYNKTQRHLHKCEANESLSRCIGKRRSDSSSSAKLSGWLRAENGKQKDMKRKLGNLLNYDTAY